MCRCGLKCWCLSKQWVIRGLDAAMPELFCSWCWLFGRTGSNEWAKTSVSLLDVGEEWTNEWLRLPCLSVAVLKNERTSGMIKITIPKYCRVGETCERVPRRRPPCLTVQSRGMGKWVLGIRLPCLSTT